MKRDLGKLNNNLAAIFVKCDKDGNPKNFQYPEGHKIYQVPPKKLYDRGVLQEHMAEPTWFLPS